MLKHETCMISHPQPPYTNRVMCCFVEAGLIYLNPFPLNMITTPYGYTAAPPIDYMAPPYSPPNEE